MPDDKKFTAEAAINVLNTNIKDLGFMPRDADPTDFQRGSDRSLRLKTGCAYGEITTLPMIDNKQQAAIRATSWAGVDRMLMEIRGIVDRHDRTPEGRR